MCFDPVSIIAGITTAVQSMGTTLAAVSTVATVGATGLSAYSMHQNSKAQAEAATMNAKAQDRAALAAIEQGQQESDRQRLAGAQAAASNVAGMASNGVDVEGADTLDLLDDNKTLLEEDAFTIRENARRTAGNHSQSAANYRASASQAKSDAFFKPMSTVLTGAAKVGNKYASLAANGGSY